MKKIATHNISPQNSDCFYSNNDMFWKVNWMATTNGHSVTEGGSSGSPLLNNNKKVIGQLYGAGPLCANPNCSNPAEDIANYGKFNISWTGNNATDSRRRLRDWLDPTNTNPQTLDGIGYPSISGPSTLCDQATYTISNFPPGATAQWSASNGNIAFTSASGTGDSTAVFSQTGYGSSEIRADILFNGAVIAPLSFSVTTCLPSISGRSLMCPNSSAKFTIHNPLSEVIWEGSGSLTFGSSFGNIAIFSSGAPGWGLVTAKIGTDTVVSKYITVSPGGAGSISGPATIPANGRGHYLVEVPCPASGPYTWKLTNKNNSADVLTLETDNPSATVVSRTGGVPGVYAWYTLSVAAGGSEYSMTISGGSGQRFLLNWDGPIISPDFTLFPNPAASSVTVSLLGNNETESMQGNSVLSNAVSGPYVIQLWSALGLVKQVITDQSQYQLDLTGVPPGFYYVHVIKDGQTYRQQLVVQ